MLNQVSLGAALEWALQTLLAHPLHRIDGPELNPATFAQSDDTLPLAERRAEAEQLLVCAAGVSRAQLRAFPERSLAADQWILYRDLILRRCHGEPLAYIEGRCGFWSLELEVTRDTLVPRADTEILVDWVLQLRDEARTELLDLGTGSGAISLAVGGSRPNWLITACDLSPEALEVAKRNSARNGIFNVSFHRSDWFSALPPRCWDIIVSNPPYIAIDDPHLNTPELQHEPLSALVAGKDGLAALRLLVELAPPRLHPDGDLLLEHGYDQGAQVRKLMRDRGFDAVETRRDHGGRERVTRGIWRAE